MHIGISVPYFEHLVNRTQQNDLTATNLEILRHARMLLILERSESPVEETPHGRRDQQSGEGDEDETRHSQIFFRRANSRTEEGISNCCRVISRGWLLYGVAVRRKYTLTRNYWLVSF